MFSGKSVYAQSSGWRLRRLGLPWKSAIRLTDQLDEKTWTIPDLALDKMLFQLFFFVVCCTFFGKQKGLVFCLSVCQHLNQILVFRSISNYYTHGMYLLPNMDSNTAVSFYEPYIYFFV